MCTTTSELNVYVVSSHYSAVIVLMIARRFGTAVVIRSIVEILSE